MSLGLGMKPEPLKWKWMMYNDLHLDLLNAAQTGRSSETTWTCQIDAAGECGWLVLMQFNRQIPGNIKSQKYSHCAEHMFCAFLFEIYCTDIFCIGTPFFLEKSEYFIWRIRHFPFFYFVFYFPNSFFSIRSSIQLQHID